MSHIHKIIGPPGTGKTYRVLDEIQSALNYYSADVIGAISHTNAAVNEMRNRIFQTLNNHIYPKHVRTLHSLCFGLLGLDKELVAETHLDEFNEAYPQYKILSTYRVEEESESSEIIRINTHNFQAMQILRNKLIDKSLWPEGVVEIGEVWAKWMEKKGYYDYTMMLERVLLIDRYPDIDVLFIDEAQDLTRLQMTIIMKWALNVHQTVIVGDADQSIFRFAGAEPEIFRDIKHDSMDILSQSYRVPRAIYSYSQNIINQIQQREKSEYSPTNIQGTIYKCDAPNLSLPGSHMLICRCNYRVKYWIKQLNEANKLYHNPYKPEDKWWNPADTKEYIAIKTYLNLCAGGYVSIKNIPIMVECIIAKENIIRGMKQKIIDQKYEDKRVDMFAIAKQGFTEEFLTFKKPLQDIFKIKSDGGKLALRLAEAGKLENNQPVCVGTIHSVKGGEADNVWVDLKRTKKIRWAMDMEPEAADDERRIEYVGVTRARHTCGIMEE